MAEEQIEIAGASVKELIELFESLHKNEQELFLSGIIPPKDWKIGPACSLEQAKEDKIITILKDAVSPLRHNS